jgi:hypothetical protein
MIYIPVIPGRREAAGPESTLRSATGYGFRVRGLKPAPRNDELITPAALWVQK